MVAPSFVHFDVRSCFSLKEGAFTPEQLVARAVELGMPAVAIGQCNRRHAEFGGATYELFGCERAFLQREARPDIEMHERRVRRAGVAQRRLQGESNRCSSLRGAVAPVQTWREMRYLPDVEPLPVGFAPGAGPFGGGASWSAVLGPAG